tara:strand:- start:11470 stop:12681 length:1212 start_codon:yes stop_codon:yes gene_type:complete
MSLKNAVGGVLLIVGTSVGAAVLVLPVATANLGLFGALSIYFVCWLFMTIGALCILEANLSTGFGTNMITMAETFLGKPGKWLTWITYLILFYALTSAYLSGTSAWIMHLFDHFKMTISTQQAAILGAIGLMLIISLGAHITDLFNRVLMVGLFASFLLLGGITSTHVSSEVLFQTKAHFDILQLPLIITAFGFAIIVPTLAEYLHGKANQLYHVILVGSLAPLLIYIIWQILIMGTLPATGEHSLTAISASGNPATELPKQLDQVLGHPWITQCMNYFSIFALFSSILGVCLSLYDFLADGLHIKKNLKGKSILALITFLPPLGFVYYYPEGFIMALSFAGIFVALLLGILPAMMVWSMLRHPERDVIRGWIGQKWLLCLTILFFVGIIGIQCYNLANEFTA